MRRRLVSGLEVLHALSQNMDFSSQKPSFFTFFLKTCRPKSSAPTKITYRKIETDQKRLKPKFSLRANALTM
jgi:hypothetical protein